MLLLRATDSSLLRLKELGQLRDLHLHRLAEMEESRSYREGTLVLPAPSSLPPELGSGPSTPTR